MVRSTRILAEIHENYPGLSMNAIRRLLSFAESHRRRHPA